MLLFIRNLKIRIKKKIVVLCENKLPAQFKCSNDKYLVTQKRNDFPFNCQEGLVVDLSDEMLITAINYFYKKATLEIKHFQNKKIYKSISKEKNEVLYYTGRILPSQEFDGKLNLSDVCIDLTVILLRAPCGNIFTFSVCLGKRGALVQ